MKPTIITAINPFTIIGNFHNWVDNNFTKTFLQGLSDHSMVGFILQLISAYVKPASKNCYSCDA